MGIELIFITYNMSDDEDEILIRDDKDPAEMDMLLASDEVSSNYHFYTTFFHLTS